MYSLTGSLSLNIDIRWMFYLIFSMVFWRSLGVYGLQSHKVRLDPIRLDVPGGGWFLVHRFWYTCLCGQLKYIGSGMI